MSKLSLLKDMICLFFGLVILLAMPVLAAYEEVIQKVISLPWLIFGGALLAFFLFRSVSFIKDGEVKMIPPKQKSV